MTLLVAVTKYPEEAVSWMKVILGRESIAAEVRQQEPETDSHVAFTVRKQRDKNAGAQFLLFMLSGPPTH